MRVPPELIAELARASAAAWLAHAARTYAGTLELETRTSVYTFHDGILVARSRKPTRAFDTPPGSRCIRLVGFLADDAGGFSFSPRWRPGSVGVMLRVHNRPPHAARSCLVTTRTLSLEREVPPVPSSAVRLAPSPSPVGATRPPPPSCTRLFAAKVG